MWLGGVVSHVVFCYVFESFAFWQGIVSVLLSRIFEVCRAKLDRGVVRARIFYLFFWVQLLCLMFVRCGFLVLGKCSSSCSGVLFSIIMCYKWILVVNSFYLFFEIDCWTFSPANCRRGCCLLFLQEYVLLTNVIMALPVVFVGGVVLPGCWIYRWAIVEQEVPALDQMACLKIPRGVIRLRLWQSFLIIK